MGICWHHCCSYICRVTSLCYVLPDVDCQSVIETLQTKFLYESQGQVKMLPAQVQIVMLHKDQSVY